MKLAAPKRKLVKISPEQFFERIVALPAADSVIKNRVVTLCSTSLPRSTPTPGHIIVTRPTPVKPTVNEAKKELLDSNQIKELNLLSKGKKLLDCCKTGDVAEVKKLIKENAPFIADWVGTSPLHYAVMNKHVEIAELLLKEGISRDSKNKVNRTPLHIAAHMGLAYMVKLLLTYGADVNCRDMLGMTPLHWAAEGADLLTTRILLDYGADVTIVSKFGRTACTTAKINKNNEIVKTILDTEVLPASVRAQKVSEMRSKIIITVRQNLIPVAEILEPSSKAMTTPHTQDKRKKRVVPSDHEADYIAGIENLKQTWKQADGEEKMSADSAIRLLQSHGVSIMEPDKETVLSSAVLNGHMIRLTEAGKLAFKSLEHNVRLDKTSSGTNGQSDSDDGTTPVKRPKISSCSVIVGSSLPECIVDLPPKDPSPVNDNGTPKNLYMQRLKSKQKDITRHVEILRNQLAIKERELNEVNLQINTIESGLNK